MKPKTSEFPKRRLRRLRTHAKMRDLVRENQLFVNDLVLPLFVTHGRNIKKPIASMPGHFQWSVDRLAEEISEIVALKIPAIILFGIPERKDALGSMAYHPDNVIQQAIKLIKQQAPELLIITDLCFCEYTDHGHCGIIKNETTAIIDNDETLILLAKQAVSHAQAGADVIAPSGMIDGMVQAVRHGLDEAGFQQLPILSYSTKYASAFYGPFREAAEGAPQFGDRRTHQMDAANSNEALHETELDILEGADMLMVKPAHTYLDIIQRVRTVYPKMPLAAYHVSGEFAMLKAAAAQNWIDEKAAALEVLTAIKRAGANFIITYYAKEVARWLQA